METYNKFRPTQFDPRGIGLDEQQNWFVLPVSQTRDSGPRDRSNFQSALDALGGESETVEVHRFGHWGPGWFEIIIVAPDSPAAAIAEDLERGLMDYPIVDDEHYSNTQHEEYQKDWQNYAARDFARSLRKHHGLSDRAFDILDDNRDELIELYEAGIHSGEFYIEESSGLYLQTDRSAQDTTRSALAAFLKEHRNQ